MELTFKKTPPERKKGSLRAAPFGGSQVIASTNAVHQLTALFFFFLADGGKLRLMC